MAFMEEKPGIKNQEKLIDYKELDWRQLLVEASKHISSIQEINKRLEIKITKASEMYKDLKLLKKDLKNFQTEIKYNTQQITEIIQQLENQNKMESRVKVQKLKDGFQKETERTKSLMQQVLQKNYDAKQSQVQITQQRQQQHQIKKQISRIDDDPDDDPEDEEETDQYFKQQQDMKYQEIDLEAEILKERAVDLNQVEEFVVEIKDMMIQAAEEIHHQGEQIDIITENVDKSKKEVTEGLEHIQEANRLHKSATKKMFCCCQIM